jgi:diguanylate cyclase (GGDEF)-like protein
LVEQVALMPHLNLAALSKYSRDWFSATVLGAAMIVVLWAGLTLKHVENRTGDLIDFKRDAENLALLSEENVLRSIGEMDKALLYLRRTIETTAEPRDLHALINTTDVLSELIVQMAIIDEKGIMRASNAGPQPAPPTDLSDREHFRAHLRDDRDFLHISKPLIGRASGKWSVQLTRRMLHADGGFAGVVVASFNPAHFAKFFGNIDLGPSASYAIIGDDGVVRAAGDHGGGSRFKLGQEVGRSALMPMLAGANGSFDELDAATQEDRLVTIRRVSGYPLAVVISVDARAIYASSQANLGRYMLAGLVLTLMIAIVTWLARASEREVKLKARQLQLTLEHMSQGIMLVTQDLTIPIMNRKCVELLDLPEAFITHPPNFIELTSYQEQRGEFATAGLADHQTPLEVFGPLDVAGKFEMYERTRPDGTVLEVRSTRLDDGSFVRTFADVTRRMKAQNEADRLANEDALTGLANRRVLGEALDRLTCREGEAAEHAFAILYLDLDRFKIVNDTQGHAVGDLLLKAVAKRMRQSLRSTDLVARLGGDEFAILLHSANKEPFPEVVAQRMVETLSRPYEIEGHQLLIGTSIGVAIGPTDGATTNELLIAADLALYAAKAAGRGTYRFFRKEMNEEIRARQEIETDLRAALTDDQLELYYQPIVALADRRIVGFEALARWNHPVRGLVMPDKFISVAEDCGLINVLGEWALRSACRQAAQWKQPLKVAVNLSPSQFASPSLLQMVERVIAESGIDANRVELEITEGLLMRNTDKTLQTLHELKKIGVRIAMDDFGTGYSSLSYLQSFPFDKIKVDRSFVSTLDSAPQSATIVRSVIDIASSLGMMTTAEGIETEAQCMRLSELGCDEAQGYLFGRPLPWGEAALLLAANDPIGRKVA